MANRYIETDEFEKRIKPYDTDDPMDKALYNFALNKMLCTPTADVTEQVSDAHNEGYDVGYWSGRRDYEPKWTPISERLPEEDGKYIVCGNNKIWICRFMCLGITCGWCNDARNPRVEAWMPLPEPYRKETENE